jgi:iron complex transport system substrate-binding protein
MIDKKIIIGCLVILAMLSIAVSADSYVLEVYGNANMDDTINDDDVIYVQEIINGSEKETQFADANSDGKINATDIQQIKDIMAGTAKTLTISDYDKKIKTVNLPVDSIASSYNYQAWAAEVLGKKDKIVAIDQSVKDKEGLYLNDLLNLPSIGSWEEYDTEGIIGLKPDLVIVITRDWLSEGNKNMESLIESAVPGSSMISIMPRNMGEYMGEMAKLSYVLGASDRWNEVRKFIESIEDTISGKVGTLPEKDKVKTLVIDMDHSEDKGAILTLGDKAQEFNQVIEKAGGINIASNLSGRLVEVDPEWIIEENPDVIVMSRVADMGYFTDNSSGSEEFMKNFMEKPWVQQTNAGKNKRVYLISWAEANTEWFIGLSYIAKMLYPDLFEDLHPQELQQEFINKYLNMDYNLQDNGVFVYPGIQDGNKIIGIPVKK